MERRQTNKRKGTNRKNMKIGEKENARIEKLEKFLP